MPRRSHKTNDKPLTTAQQLGSLIKSARDIMRKDKGLNGDLDRLPTLTWIMFLKFLDDMERIREQKAKLSGTRYRPVIDPPYRWRDWAAKEDGVTGDELMAFVNQDEAVRPDGKRGPGLFAYLRGLQSENGRDRRDVVANVFRGTLNRMVNGYLLRDVINKVNGIHFDSSEEIHTLGHLYETMLREMRDAAGDSGEFYTPRPVVRFMVEVTNPRLGETVLDPACGTGGFLVEAFNHFARQCKTVQDRRVLQERSIRGVEAKPLPYLLAQMNLLLHDVEYPEIAFENALKQKLSDIGDRDRVDAILTNPPFGGEEETGIKSNFPPDKQTSETALLFLQLIMRKLKRGSKPGRAAVVVPESVMSDKGVAAKIRRELIEELNLHTVVRLPKGVFEPYSDIQTNLLFFDRSASTSGTWFVEHEVPLDRQGMQNPCYTQSFPLRFEELQPVLEWWPKREETRQAWYVPKTDIVAAGYSFDFRNPHKRQAEITSVNDIILSFVGPLEQATGIVSRLKTIADSSNVWKSSSGERMPLKTFLTQVRNEDDLNDTVVYKQITVKLYGKGAILRQALPGREIRTRPQFIARAGQLIMSRIDARNGAFAIVPPELDAAVVTQDFPLFEVNQSVIEAEFLAILLRSHSFLEACKRASRGTTNRKRLREATLLEELVPIPSKTVQRSIVELACLLKALEHEVGSLTVSADAAIPKLANFVFG